MSDLHETLRAHSGPERTSSDRAFGLWLAGLFAILALAPLVREPRVFRGWAAAVSLALVLVSAFAPHVLAPINRIWTRLGRALQRLMSPIVLALVFFVVILPIGLVLRLAGKDLLRLRRDPRAESYWIRRDPPGPPPGSSGHPF